MKSDPDTYTMLQFKNGDDDAFRRLFKKYRKRIINFCYRFCGNQAVAEELAQEVFIRVYKAAPRYKPKARFSTWIFRIATNICLNEVRRKQYKYQSESLDAPISTRDGDIRRDIEDTEQLTADSMLTAQEEDTQIQQALMSLPENQRMALLLRIRNDFSYAQIGEALNCPENRVKTFIHRGRQRLKTLLSPLLKDEM